VILTDAGGGPGLGPIVLEVDRYLVMGDNRDDSLDGRMFGPVARDAILGRAMAVVYRDGPVWSAL
jgi:signal peptidase I